MHVYTFGVKQLMRTYLKKNRSKNIHTTLHMLGVQRDLNPAPVYFKVDENPRKGDQ
jgi:hypothetical protein